MIRTIYLGGQKIELFFLSFLLNSLILANVTNAKIAYRAVKPRFWVLNGFVLG